VAEKKWGVDRCKCGYAWRSMLKAGIKVQFGSDAPVEHINPLLSFHAAIARQNLAGAPQAGWFPAERLTLEETLHAFTAVPAWTSRKEAQLGMLAPGKIADLTVFAEDLSALAPEKLPSAQVEMTIVGGEVTHRK